MQLTKYHKIYPSNKNIHSIILYSTKNAAVVEMPKSLAEKLPDPELSGEDRKTLRKLGFLINSPDKEKKELLGYIDELNELNRTLNIKLVMNLDCNLACKYCFEGTRKGRFYMTNRTADDFIRFVMNKVRDRDDFEEILITYYGGEPLLSTDLITYISRKLKFFARDIGIRFRFYFVTNGTMLSKEIVKTLKPLGLKEAYITIDGPRKVHDRFRPFRTGRGSFDIILKNVKDVSGLIKVKLGGNFSRENYMIFPKLLGYLHRNGLKPPKINSVQFFPVAAESAGFGPPDFHEGCASVNEPWLFEASLFLREEILKRGFRLEKIAPGVCMMEYKNNLLVNYDGSIYKCPGLIGREEFKVGDIKTGIKDFRMSHNLDNWKNDECLDCASLPLCFGGCRYMKLVRDGNMDGVDCKKPYLDATLETLVKQDIRYGLTV